MTKELKISTVHTYYMFGYMCVLAGEAKILLIKCQPLIWVFAFGKDIHPL